MASYGVLFLYSRPIASYGVLFLYSYSTILFHECIVYYQRQETELNLDPTHRKEFVRRVAIKSVRVPYDVERLPSNNTYLMQARNQVGSLQHSGNYTSSLMPPEYSCTLSGVAKPGPTRAQALATHESIIIKES